MQWLSASRVHKLSPYRLGYTSNLQFNGPLFNGPLYRDALLDQKHALHCEQQIW
jgi:hypothetical protein